MKTNASILILILLLFIGCKNNDGKKEQNEQPTSLVAVSLSGKQFYEPQRTPAAQARLDSLLNIAQQNFNQNPSEENYIWLGRRTGYLSHFKAAIDIFTEGVAQYPDSYKLYRHRGHRYISTREFDKAIADFEKAAALMQGKPIEIEPDGIPNKLNKPLGSTQFNVWYHLALGYYLKGDFIKAENAYKQCRAVSDNDDSIVATDDWLYMTLRRQKKDKEAAALLSEISPNMTIIENDSYYKRLMMYKGLMSPDSLLMVGSDADDRDLSLATQGYGVGNWYLYNGDTTKAKQIFEQVTAGNHFSAFGFIAAETELHRLK
jgi:tetratricopeptide (TPR) repeat protein